MKNKILGGLGILIGLLVLGGVLNGSPKSEVAGTKIEKIIVTPSSVVTPAPTVTPTPTITPSPSLAPTPTSIPTLTIKPTAVPTQVITPAVDAGCGTYINSAGNEVARPCPANEVPAGATARCRDGSYSYSQNRRGTCSSHGGVTQWL